MPGQLWLGGCYSLVIVFGRFGGFGSTSIGYHLVDPISAGGSHHIGPHCGASKLRGAHLTEAEAQAVAGKRSLRRRQKKEINETTYSWRRHLRAIAGRIKLFEYCTLESGRGNVYVCV